MIFIHLSFILCLLNSYLSQFELLDSVLLLSLNCSQCGYWAAPRGHHCDDWFNEPLSKSGYEQVGGEVHRLPEGLMPISIINQQDTAHGAGPAATSHCAYIIL